MLHAHSASEVGADDQPFVVALCPGHPETGGAPPGLDWGGCETDPRSIVE